MIGQVIGGYRVLELVGKGSNGTVWRAEHPELKNLAAIKFLPHDLTLKHADRQRFIRGARAVARLHHPGIASVFAADFSGESPYIIAEFVPGDTVNALAAKGPLPADRAVEITLQAARALRYAHKEGVFHRDISGGNIMVTPEGRAKIVDFGMAVERDETRMTTQGTVFGTVPYMAPEVLRGDLADESRDTYALGVILYQLLTGRLPFMADTTEALVYLILTKHAKPPSVHKPSLPASVDRLVLLALDKDPRRRCTLERLITDLEKLQASGKLEDSERTRSVDSRVGMGTALWRLRRRLTTMSPTQVRVLVTVASVTVLTLGVLGWLVSRALPQGPVRPKVASLAILPFFNESPDGAFEYIGHGLAEHLAGRLEGLEGLLVQPYRRTLSGDAEDLVSRLNVEGVLEGSFSVAGGEVETRVDLVRSDGKRETLARKTSRGYKRAAEELAGAVAEGLKSRLTPKEEGYVGQPAAASNEAFDALSTAVDAHHRGDRDEALRWYERAVGLDPGLAKAYVGIGGIYYDRYFRSAAGMHNLAAAESNFRQALALDPYNGGAERGLILVHYERGERDSGLAVAKRAAGGASEIDKLLIPAWAYTLNPMPELAVPLLKQVTGQDPLNEEALWFLVIASAWSGQAQETIRAGDDFVHRFGEDPEVLLWVAIAQWQLGHIEIAEKNFDRALALFRDDTQLYVSASAGTFFHQTGNEVRARQVWTDALRIAERRRKLAPDNLRLRGMLADFYVRLGRNAEFLTELATIDTLYANATMPHTDESESWQNHAYAVPELKGPTLRFMEKRMGPRDPFWLGPTNAVGRAPELAPIAAAARAYDDSLRRKYGLPERRKSPVWPPTARS